MKKFTNKKLNMTQEEVGEILGLTKMRVCQIEKKALKKLRNKLKSIGVEDYEDFNNYCSNFLYEGPSKYRDYVFRGSYIKNNVDDAYIRNQLLNEIELIMEE